MRLEQLSAGLPGSLVGGDAEIEEIGFDSRSVSPGMLFVCVRGLRSDGHEFAAQAAAAGAVALVVEERLDVDLPQFVVPDSRAAMGPLAARLFGHPSMELAMVGVTGTNGKTTTTFLVRSILEGAGTRCGLLGTVKRVVGGVEEEVERTTPEAIDLQRTMRRMVESGDEACALEVSSHALVLGRAAAIDFDVAAFTNLTQDHLDFHADMEDYFGAKRELFLPEARGTTPVCAVVNIDDTFGERLADELEATGKSRLTRVSSAGNDADLSAREIEFDAAGARFELHGAGPPREVRLPLAGHFNVDNALAALGAALALGIDPAAAVEALAGAEPVPGRMEPVDAGQDFAVLVDYAHTPDSLDNVLAAGRKLTDGRLISVFGCGGDRDPHKRPLMGAAAASASDLTIVTSDNPRNEDPDAIIAGILEGIDHGSGDGVRVEPDRREAIAAGVAAAEPGDLLVIAGKGHEQGQELAGGHTVPFDDREVAREAIERRLSGETSRGGQAGS